MKSRDRSALPFVNRVLADFARASAGGSGCGVRLGYPAVHSLVFYCTTLSVCTSHRLPLTQSLTQSTLVESRRAGCQIN